MSYRLISSPNLFKLFKPKGKDQENKHNDNENDKTNPKQKKPNHFNNLYFIKKSIGLYQIKESRNQ